MIIEKETKSIYALLKKVYEILNKGGEHTALYVNEELEIIYQANGISGKIKATRDGYTVFQGSLEKERFYELSKLPRDMFKLKVIEYADVTQPMKETLESLQSRFSENEFINSMGDEEHCLLSRITRTTKMYISDSFLPFIKKFGGCSVWKKGAYVILSRSFFPQGEYMQIDEIICFSCETYGDADKRTQEKIMHEEEQKYAGEA